MKNCLSELENKAAIVRKTTGIDLDKEYEYTRRIKEASDPDRKASLWILPLLIYGATHQVMMECKRNGDIIAPRLMFQIAIHNMAKKGELDEYEAIEMLMQHAKQEEIEKRKLAGKEISLEDYNEAYFVVGINKLIERRLVVVGDGGIIHITNPCPNYGFAHMRVAWDNKYAPGMKYGLLDGNVMWGKKAEK